MAINKVIMTGRLTAAPELKMTPAGVPVTTFSLAQNKSRDAVDFFDFVAWRETAKFICKYFKRGDGIEIVGHLQSRSYEKNGYKQKVYEIVVDGAAFPVGRRSSDGDGDSAPAFASATSRPDFEEIPTDENLPF